MAKNAAKKLVEKPVFARELSLLSRARSLVAANGSIQESPGTYYTKLPIDDLHERRRQVGPLGEGRVQDVVRRRAGRP